MSNKIRLDETDNYIKNDVFFGEVISEDEKEIKLMIVDSKRYSNKVIRFSKLINIHSKVI